MVAALLSADEKQRLATLESYEILDTPPDVLFDRLVQLASDHFDVPMSLVSLVGSDRQWFKASVGLDVRETPRDRAFCAHAILAPHEVMVVENTEDDDRFVDNPLVTEDPSIRFYAGAPIRALNGQPLGTLCILDRKPRQIDEAGRRFLANLADSAGSMLELHRNNLLLSAVSGRDPLTGLANRRVFDATLSSACASASTSTPHGLLALDLDHFKLVNDQFGHEVGDMLLVEVGQRLSRVVRGKDLVARLGGDEFAVIPDGPTEAVGLVGLARRIMNVLLPPFTYRGDVIPIQASIGVAVAPMHGDDAKSLSRAADLALYSAKRSGRHAIVLSDGLEHPEVDRRADLEHELRVAVSEETLVLHWQPYFSADGGGPVGFEALLRWTPAGCDPVPAKEIVAMAEKGGFIAALDAMVLSKACTAAAAWPMPLRVSVNMSAWWFNEGDLVQMVTDALAASGLPAERLTIELTEATLVRYTEQAHLRICGLQELGVIMALDDFGTGYASLGYLASFTFNCVKLDQTFVEGIGASRRAEAVVHAVMALARALEMMVCAEGVETPEQLDFLQIAGCDLIQGFLLGHPVAAITWAPPFCEAGLLGLLHAGD